VDLAAYRRVAADSYLDGLTSLPIGEVRRLRADCQVLEDEVSLQRRVIQGRLDIIRYELDRRRSGAAPSEAGQLLGSLPEVLSSTTSGGHHDGHGAGTSVDEFADLDGIDEYAVLDLAGLTDAALDSTHDQFGFAEHVLSRRRQRLFERLDALSGEITRRYRTGEASIGTLLQ
jgi:hypothetical protein